jgi:hypothetical protein
MKMKMEKEGRDGGWAAVGLLKLSLKVVVGSPICSVSRFFSLLPPPSLLQPPAPALLSPTSLSVAIRHRPCSASSHRIDTSIATHNHVQSLDSQSKYDCCSTSVSHAAHTGGIGRWGFTHRTSATLCSHEAHQIPNPRRCHIRRARSIQTQQGVHRTEPSTPRHSALAPCHRPVHNQGELGFAFGHRPQVPGTLQALRILACCADCRYCSG